jgi:hypothetical protein
MPMNRVLLPLVLVAGCAAAVLGLGHARAQVIGGPALMAVCSGTDPEQVGDCVGFISGVADSFAVIQLANPGHDQICIPSGTNPGKVHDAVINVLNADPGTAQRPAAVDVAQALHVAYPCAGAAAHGTNPALSTPGPAKTPTVPDAATAPPTPPTNTVQPK